MLLNLRQLSLIFNLAISSMLITGCGNYELTLNERTLYDPTEFQRSVHLPDPGLQACVKTVLSTQKITGPGKLKKLLCGPGAIVSLEGLAIFTHLEHIGLADNAVSDLSELGELKQLKQLNLGNNQIVDASVLVTLSNLNWLNLEKNNDLHCDTLRSLKESVTLVLPNHCKR